MEFTEVLKIFLTAMLPVVELRGALPLAIAKGMQPVAALALCTAGNLLPVPFIILFARRLLGWMRRFAWLQRFSSWLERKAQRNSARLARGEFLGLMILVAIPLPGTGAWTGALVASLLGMRLRSRPAGHFSGRRHRRVYYAGGVAGRERRDLAGPGARRKGAKRFAEAFLSQ